MTRHTQLFPQSVQDIKFEPTGTPTLTPRAQIAAQIAAALIIGNRVSLLDQPGTDADVARRAVTLTDALFAEFEQQRHP